MKKMICMMLMICLTAALWGCGGSKPAETSAPEETGVPEESSEPAESTASDNVKHIASAYLRQDSDNAAELIVELTGGWSVEFARGAAYIAKGDKLDETAAMLLVLDQEVYEENLAEAMEDPDHKEADGGIYYTYYDGRPAFLASVNDDIQYLISIEGDAEIEDMVRRCTVKAD
ncbi:MAG: hypothetical protein IKI23_08415 [Lachnospiraceae bacterium]|nr:hypothetical protein [Lachnospiraceae bacterium]